MGLGLPFAGTCHSEYGVCARVPQSRSGDNNVIEDICVAVVKEGGVRQKKKESRRGKISRSLLWATGTITRELWERVERT